MMAYRFHTRFLETKTVSSKSSKIEKLKNEWWHDDNQRTINAKNKVE